MCFNERIVLLGVVAALLSSCNVLEDRGGCPCLMTVDLSDRDNCVCDSLLVAVASLSGDFRSVEVVPQERYAEPLNVKVPLREGVLVTALDYAVARKYRHAPTGDVIIPGGEECPPTYMYSAFLPTEEESVLARVKVCKNYCGVTMNFASADLDFYSVQILGNVCGYGQDGTPVTGEFRFCPSTDNPCGCYFRLPRQVDSSLKMGISTSDGNTRYFAIGNYIEQSGYDWSKADLDDLILSIDYSSTALRLSINDWKVEQIFDVTI